MFNFFTKLFSTPISSTSETESKYPVTNPKIKKNETEKKVDHIHKVTFEEKLERLRANESCVRNKTLEWFDLDTKIMKKIEHEKVVYFRINRLKNEILALKNDSKEILDSIFRESQVNLFNKEYAQDVNHIMYVFQPLSFKMLAKGNGYLAEKYRFISDMVQSTLHDDIGFISSEYYEILNFETAPPWMKSNPEILKVILARDGMQLLHASQDLKKDKDLVRTAVLQNGNALEFADPLVKDDPEFITEVSKENPKCIKFAGNIALKEVLSQDGLLLEYTIGEVKKDYDLCKIAYKQNIKALEFVDRSLRRRMELSGLKQFLDKNMEDYSDQCKLDIISIIKSYLK